MAQQTATSAAPAPPIIIDLGKVKKKKVRQLKEGRGELTLEVQQVLADTRGNLGPDGANKELVPIILVYQRKRGGRKRKGGGGIFPF